MRILRLDVGSDLRIVDLHPFVTVVHELGEAERRDVIEAVRSMARGSTAGIRGLVQNQGLLVELDGEGNDRLSALTSANVVIDEDTLGADDLSWLRAQVDQQRRRAEIEAVVVEEIRADLDPSARARLAAFEERLAPADQEETERCRRLVEEIVRALEIVAGLTATVLEAPAGVADLHHRYVAHNTRVLEAADHLSGLRVAIDRAEARLDSAGTALGVAESEARAVLLTRDEESRLELLAFPGMDESRRGKWRKQLRPQEQQEMQDLLGKVGVESWTAYTVYRTAPTVSQERLDTLHHAQAGVLDATAHLSEMNTNQDNDRRYRELTEQTEKLRSEARDHLGLMLPGDVARALGQLVVEKENPQWLAAVRRLEQLLDENRIAMADERVDASLLTRSSEPPVSPEQWSDQTVHRAETWLRAQHQDQESLDAETVGRQMDSARGALDRHRRALSRITRAEESATAAAIGLAQLQEQLAARSGGSSNTVDGLLAFVEPIATQVALEARGSLPIAVVGDLGGIADADLGRLLDRLSEISEGLQVLVITDRPAARAWARGVGLDRAMASRARTAAIVESS